MSPLEKKQGGEQLFGAYVSQTLHYNITICIAVPSSQLEPEVVFTLKKQLSNTSTLVW